MARSVSNLGDSMDRKFGIIGRQPAHCEAHGDYSAVILRVSGLSGCPICASGKRDMEELERKRSQFRVAQHDSAKIPKRFAEKTFGDFVVSSPAQQVALDACTEYVDNFSKHKREGRCMLLLGKVGRRFISTMAGAFPLPLSAREISDWLDAHPSPLPRRHVDEVVFALDAICLAEEEG